jgi:hypothetical protein
LLGAFSLVFLRYIKKAKNMKKKLLVLITALCTFGCINQTKAQAGAALNLDGNATFVDFGSNVDLGLQSTAFSMEAWVKPAGGSGGQLILFNGACNVMSGGWGLSYNGGDFTASGTPNPGKLSFYVLSSVDNNYYQLDQLSNLPIGQWTHVAVTNDGTALKMYINGVLDNTLTGHYIPVATNSSLKIGADPNLACNQTPRFVYNGSIDELRLYKYTLTPCQIQAGLNCELQSKAGLILYCQFNEGIAAGTNTITTVADSSGNGFNGTMHNFALSGTTSNWIAPGGVTSGVSCGLILSRVYISASSQVISVGNTTTLTASGATSYTWTNTGATTTSIVVSPTVTTTYTIAGSDGTCTLTDTLTIFVNAAALNFDGVDDNVSIPNNAALNISNVITIESWIKTTGSPTAEQYIVTKNDDSYYVGLNVAGAVGQVSFYLNGVSSSWLYSNSTTLNDNNWHHIACTYDGVTMSIYVDGLLDNSTPLTGTITTGTSNVYLGSRNNNQFFQGSMDEFRIWNRTLCAQEIQHNMTGEVATNANSLVAYYKFNQGYNGSDNSAITTLTDATGTNTGTLSNFALTGATSNFIAPGAVTTGSMVTAFTNSINVVPTQTNVTCNGNANGTASVTATSMATPFTYAWSSGGSTTNTATGLAANNYTCTISNTCGASITQAFTITEPAVLTATSTSGTIACNGGATTVTVSATGGTTSYSGDGIMSNVTAGSYTYTVTDAHACAATTTITITQPAQALMATSTSGTIACNGGTTTVTVSATGGITNYSGTGTYTNVPANSYTYTVTDANNCTVTTTITVSEPTQIMVTATAGTINCNGAATTVSVSATGGTPTYTGDSTYTVTANSYTYTVTDANNCSATTTITVNQPNAIATTQSPSICVGSYFTVGTHTYTTAGTYTDVLSAHNGCDSTVTTNLTVNSLPSLTFVINNGIILCDWGSASNTPNYTLTATPGGGAFSGTAVSGNVFSPYQAGIGTFTLTYNYTNTATTCSNSTTATTTVSICEGIAQNNAATNNLQVYPNPFSNELTIVSTAKTNAMLFDMLGNKINEFVLQNTTQTISLGNLAPGMYYLQVDNSKIKIIKQ